MHMLLVVKVQIEQPIFFLISNSDVRQLCCAAAYECTTQCVRYQTAISPDRTNII